MNSEVPQYKNCWKQDHTVGVCCIQGAKYLKCNGPHLTDHHQHFAWYCKANDKVNPPRPKTNKGIHALIHSNASTVKVNTRPTLTTALSGNTTSTRSSL